MTALAILIPGLVVGAIAWGAVGVLRQRGREEFTLTTAVAFYAQVMLIAGVLAVLAGIAVVVKLLLSTIDAGYGYAAFAGGGLYGPPTVVERQQQDLILATMLVGVGALVAIGHWLLARTLATMPNGSPSWIQGGALIAVAILTALAGFLGAIMGGYQALVYFMVPGSTPAPFADAVGAGLTFIPAWAVSMALLMRRIRNARPLPRFSPGT